MHKCAKSWYITKGSWNSTCAPMCRICKKSLSKSGRSVVENSTPLFMIRVQSLSSIQPCLNENILLSNLWNLSKKDFFPKGLIQQTRLLFTRMVKQNFKSNCLAHCPNELNPNQVTCYMSSEPENTGKQQCSRVAGVGWLSGTAAESLKAFIERRALPKQDDFCRKLYESLSKSA